jgi:membrane protein YqaA with SNARE-associated domain
MLRSLYDRMMRLAASPQGPWWLAVFAFCEGIFFPIPPDLMLMPMVLARRERAWLYAGITLVASLCGGTVGYTIGHLLEPVGRAILSLTGINGAGVDAFKTSYARWGFLVIALPIPYKLTAIVSGLASFPFATFLLASAAIRGARFFLVAALMRIYGPPIQSFVEKRLALVISAIAVLLVLAFFGLRLVH